MVHGGHDADRVVVGAQRDVFAAERGIRSLQHRDDVARPEVLLLEGHIALDGGARVARDGAGRAACRRASGTLAEGRMRRRGWVTPGGTATSSLTTIRGVRKTCSKVAITVSTPVTAMPEIRPSRPAGLQIRRAQTVPARPAVVHHDLALQRLARRQGGRIRRAADVNQGCAVDRAGRDLELRLVGVVVLPQHQLVRADPERRPGGVGGVARERDLLEIAAGVSGRLEAEPSQPRLRCRHCPSRCRASRSAAPASSRRRRSRSGSGGPPRRSRRWWPLGGWALR